MTFDYFLCGMRVRSGFPLGGMSAGEEGATGGRELELTAATAEELERRWSRPAVPGAWRGRLRDGSELRIERGRRGDLLFGNGERSSFHLDRARRHLRCAVADPLAAGFQRVLLTRVLPLVAVARGCEALHAGAVLGESGAVAIVGPSGAGKSTLVAALVRRGWPLLADDVLVLEAGDGGVRAHLGGPYLSLAAAEADVGSELGELGGKRWVAVDRAAREPARVAATVLLERGSASGPEISGCAASPLSLAPFMLGLPDDEGRDESRFRLYADLAEQAPALRLAAAVADPPAALAAVLERSLLGSPSPALSGSPA